MSIFTWIILALGGMLVLFILYLLAPILSVVFDFFAMLFRGIQLAPDWFKFLVWVFIGTFMMQLIVSFMFAGNVVCTEPGEPVGSGVPIQIDGTAGYFEAAMAKFMPYEDPINTDDLGMPSFAKTLFGGSGSEEDSPAAGEGYGTILTYGADPAIEPAIQNAQVVQAEGVLFLPNATKSIGDLLNIEPGREQEPFGTMYAKMSICGVVDSSQMIGYCLITVGTCDELSYAAGGAKGDFATIADFSYEVTEGLTGQDILEKYGYTVRVVSFDYRLSGWIKNISGSYDYGTLFLKDRSLMSSCAQTGTWSADVPKYLLKTAKGDKGYVVGEYRAFDQPIVLESSFSRNNPREKFVSAACLESGCSEPSSLPGVTFLCDETAGTDMRFLGLDIQSVQLFYFVFSIVGLVALQRFLRNW